MTLLDIMFCSELHIWLWTWPGNTLMPPFRKRCARDSLQVGQNLNTYLFKCLDLTGCLKASHSLKTYLRSKKFSSRSKSII